MVFWFIIHFICLSSVRVKFQSKTIDILLSQFKQVFDYKWHRITDKDNGQRAHLFFSSFKRTHILICLLSDRESCAGFNI